MKTVAQTVIEADHFYTIAAHTGNVIQAVEGTKEAGTVRLGKYEHKPEQEWSFIRVGDGVYRIRNRASGKLLDLTMTGTANGTWLHLWEDVGGTSQMWTVQPTPEGTVRLRSSWAGGKCVGCQRGPLLVLTVDLCQLDGHFFYIQGMLIALIAQAAAHKLLCLFEVHWLILPFCRVSPGG